MYLSYEGNSGCSVIKDSTTARKRRRWKWDKCERVRRNGYEEDNKKTARRQWGDDGEVEERGKVQGQKAET